MALDFSKLTKAIGLGALSDDGSGAVGIDIGTSSIKVAQLKRQNESAVLETYGELQLGPYAGTEIGRATNLETDKLSEALVDIVREASVTSKKAALAIPYASSFVTVVSLPTTDESKLSTMVPLEARKYVPVPIGEVTLDWFVVPSPRGMEEKKNETKVLIAAIHNEALSKHQSVLKRAGMETGFTEIEVFSTIRSSADTDDNLLLILDMGAATTKLYIVDRGIVQRTHSMTLGSQDMTLSLSQSLELKVDEAEELKRQVGLLPGQDKRISDSITFTLERILGDSMRLLKRYEQMHSLKVPKVLLTGGGAVLRGLKEYATQTFDREVALADPFSKVQYPAFLEETLEDAGPSFAVALGAALRRLNE